MHRIIRSMLGKRGKRINFVLICVFVMAASPISIHPQGKEEEPDEKLEAVVSGVRANVVEGKVFLERDNARFELTPGLELNDGDFLIGGPASRAELLLQPGNYLRLSSETRVKIVNTQYDRLRLQLDSGSISFELLKTEVPRFVDSDTLFLIRVLTPHSEVILSESGIARLRADNNGNAEIVVRKGETVVNGMRVKEKRIAREKDGVVNITEFDTKVEDDFDTWCRERAGQLVQLNRSLKKEAPWANRKDKEAIIDVPSDDDVGDSPYVVSAKPGKVTFVDSGTEVMRERQEWTSMTAETDLQSHDRLRTTANTRVELMMFPDIYFRIDGNSEVVFEELSNDAISIRLVRGAVILDTAIFDRNQLPQFRIGGSTTSAIVTSDGNYRWDINSNFAQISVRKGKLLLSGKTIDGCRRMTDGVESRCDKNRTDNFDVWSEFRGEGLFFNGRTMAGRLARLRARWLKNTGFWYRPPSVGYYTFVPYSSTSFQSPYGGNYSMVLSPRRNPAYRPDPGARQPGLFPKPIDPPNRN